jgi:hypothetical protein
MRQKNAQFHAFKDALYYAHLVANCWGLRKVWERPSQFHPYFGGGVSIIGASITDNCGGGCWYQEDSDESFGFWVGTGFYWILSEKCHTGLNFQYSYAEVELFDEKLNAGGLHFNLLIGWH